MGNKKIHYNVPNTHPKNPLKEKKELWRGRECKKKLKSLWSFLDSTIELKVYMCLVGYIKRLKKIKSLWNLDFVIENWVHMSFSTSF